MERWKKSRQDGLYSDFMQGTSSRRLPWLCKRTSTSDGKESRALFILNGSGTSQKWDQIRQQNFKSCFTPKFVSTSKIGVEGGWCI